ncbi:MAG: putative bifunctional diguanylate cyclase/phosphodiesterase, partial [Acidimicrobiales bacterium]
GRSERVAAAIEDLPPAGPWSRRAPLTALVVGIGLALSLLGWLGFRSVETDQAELDRQRDVLAQTSDLQSTLERSVSSFDALRALLDADPNPPASSLSRYLGSVGLAGEEIVVLDLDGARATIVRSFGAADPALEGTQLDLVDSALLEALTTDALAAGQTLVLAGNTTGSLFAEEMAGGSLTVLGAMGDDGTTALVSRLSFATLLERVAARNDGIVAMTVTVEDSIMGEAPADGGDPVGDPVVFTLSDARVAIQGHDDGIEVPRRGSWVLLAAGLLLTAIAGAVARSTRRHAITLGRLERSEYDARHDDLTGLLNRSGLTHRLNEELADRRGSDLVGVLFLDLDRLKVVNDSIGHSAGDEVLCVVAERLRSITRDGDVVGRFGGDEFVIVSDDVPAVSDLTALADRVLDVLKEPAILSDESSQMISASVGIAYVAKGEATAEDLLRDADLAMYRAKEKGGSRYEVFDAELREQAVARLEVERELRRAIRTGQLVVHYQPIVDVDSGEVDRLEALVRWKHPERGMVPPGAFLSVAAESGLIVDVGEHVLRESCRQAALWSGAVGRDIMVSVNVAERQLIDVSLVDTVRRVLAETGISPSQLELEITEELIVDRLDHRLTVLHDLVAMGIKLAIDDFGTSRASLGQLKKLDMVSTLKIDRAFVIDVVPDPVDRKIITAIVALADSVGMEVVAEGVEDADQVAVLRDLGVDLIQGFHFHRPAEAATITPVLNRSFELPSLDAPLPGTTVDAPTG